MVLILPQAKTDPFAGQNIKAAETILDKIIQAENQRRDKMIWETIMEVVQSGGTMADIAGVVQTQDPQFSTGISGILQKMASPFVQDTGRGIKEALLVETIRPKTKSKIAELMAEGYSKEEAKEIRDISHGLKPRAAISKMQELIDEGYSPEEAKLIRDISHGLKSKPSTKIQDLKAEGYTEEEARLIRDISYGLKPRAMATKSPIQDLIDEGYSQEEAKMIRDITHGLKPRPSATMQDLIGEGYSPEEVKLIRDISHGLKPRASTRQTFDNMTEIEKLDWLTRLKQRAEGQYYGALKAEAEAEGAGRKVEAREPRVLEWVNKELKKLKIYQEGKTQGKKVATTPKMAAEKSEPPAQPDQARLQAVGPEKAQMEMAAWGAIKDYWDHFPADLQNKIRIAGRKGISFTEIMQTDEVDDILQGIVK